MTATIPSPAALAGRPRPPAALEPADRCRVRISVAGAGSYTTDCTDEDHAREIALHFLAELQAAHAADDLVPFRAGGRSVDLMVRARRVNTVEVERVGGVR